MWFPSNTRRQSDNGNEVERHITLFFFLQVSEKHAVAKKVLSNIISIPYNELQLDSEAGDGNHSQRTLSSVAKDTDMQEGRTLQVQKDKMRVLFYEIDTSGDGRINKEEFRVFVHNLGVVISEQESDFVFDVIDEDSTDSIEYNEFYNYFVKFVLGEISASEAEAQLRSAFLSADRDGSGAISFTEFAEVAMSQGQKLAMA